MFNFTNPKLKTQSMPQNPNNTAATTPQNTKGNTATTATQTPASQANSAQNPMVEQRIAEIEAQRQAFVRKNPDFDMKAEMQNPAFVNYVWGNNLSVEDAYFLTHRNEILDQVRAEALDTFLARKERIPENGTAKNRPAIARKNPKDLSDKEIDAIIERARNGEKITF